MARLINLFISISIILISISCGRRDSKSKENEKSESQTFLNLTILLDLSDRIENEKHPDQIKRDTLIIRNILACFADQVRLNGYIYSKDKIQLLIAPQAGNNPITYNPNLDVEEVAKANKRVREVLPGLTNQFFNEAKEIYNHKQLFNGADIWTFFRDFAEKNCIKKSYSEKIDNNKITYQYKNCMIIITDGYLNFEPDIQSLRVKNNSCMQIEYFRNDPNWEKNFDKFKMMAFQGQDYDNLKILLLELNPFRPEININELSIIERYWNQWFIDMKIDCSQMHQATEPIPLINSAVKTFLQNSKN
jgi:hypothetical protein